MFERFTDRARRVVVLAQEEARLLNHNYIGTEHILLGLVHEGRGRRRPGAHVVGHLARSGAATRSSEIVGRGGHVPSGHIPFTPRAKKVLEFSLREALQLGHDYIGTEHILLGVIREGEGVAAQVLVKVAGRLDRVRAARDRDAARRGDGRRHQHDVDGAVGAAGAGRARESAYLRIVWSGQLGCRPVRRRRERAHL